MIKVYQIQLTNAEIDMINSGETSDRIQAYFDRSWPMSTFKTENFQYYTHVATVDTRDMEQAFEYMNLWHNDKVQKVTSSVSSMSVGDILECNGEFYLCASFGFSLIEGL
jgi:hypothetical protein